MARFCLIWIIMLGAMIAVRDGSHFDLDILPKPRVATRQAVSRLGGARRDAGVALVFLYFG